MQSSSLKCSTHSDTAVRTADAAHTCAVATSSLLCLPCITITGRMTCLCGVVEGAIRCRVGRQTVQLAEWWADFDERVMRPVFNKPGAMDDWTPRGGGVLSSHANCGHTWQLAFPQQRPKLGSAKVSLK